uniref:3'-5' exonuclease domain-containing protein n=1 Tax=Timema bartmani TaxID=61472 RepID=A0A7R9I2V1_9NEOP|nr:unnamed protein product [Timema bartmani]
MESTEYELRLLDKGGPRTLHDLSCQFGAKGFTKEMRQIAGGSQSGLKKFLSQHPALFAIDGDYVHVNTFNTHSTDDVDSNGSGSLKYVGSKRDYAQEAVEYFANKLIQYGVGTEVPIKSLLGHRSQASAEVRHISGQHVKEFRDFLCRFPDSFVVTDETVILKEYEGKELQPFHELEEERVDPEVTSHLLAFFSHCLELKGPMMVDQLFQCVSLSFAQDDWACIFKTPQDLTTFLKMYSDAFHVQSNLVTLISPRNSAKPLESPQHRLNISNNNNNDVSLNNINNNQYVPLITPPLSQSTPQPAISLQNQSLKQRINSLVMKTIADNTERDRNFAVSALANNGSASGGENWKAKVLQSTRVVVNVKECVQVTEDIMSQAKPGVPVAVSFDCEGINLGVKGQLTLFQIGTVSGQAFIFDLVTCPSLVSAGGLQRLLESETVIKMKPVLSGVHLVATTSDLSTNVRIIEGLLYSMSLSLKNGDHCVHKVSTPNRVLRYVSTISGETLLAQIMTILSPLANLERGFSVNSECRFENMHEQCIVAKQQICDVTLHESAATSYRVHFGVRSVEHKKLQQLVVLLIREGLWEIKRLESKQSIILENDEKNVSKSNTPPDVEEPLHKESMESSRRSGEVARRSQATRQRPRDTPTVPGADDPDILLLSQVLMTQIYLLSQVLVIHDCRNDSVNLFNQFNITLRNVFDTQAAHAVLQLQETGKPVYKVKNVSLNALCELYDAPINPMKDQLKNVYRRDQRYWARRPLSRDMMLYAAADVLALVPQVYHAMGRLIQPGYQPLLMDLCDEQVYMHIKPSEVKQRKKQRKVETEVADLRQKLSSVQSRNIVLSNREIRLLSNRKIAQGMSQGAKQDMSLGAKQDMSLGAKQGMSLGAKQGMSLVAKQGMSQGAKQEVYLDLTEEEKEKLRGSYKVARKLDKLDKDRDGKSDAEDDDDDDDDEACNGDSEYPSLDSYHSGRTSPSENSPSGAS